MCFLSSSIFFRIAVGGSASRDKHWSQRASLGFGTWRLQAGRYGKSRSEKAGRSTPNSSVPWTSEEGLDGLVGGNPNLFLRYFYMSNDDQSRF